ncbi:ankyrin repeat and SOCS box protein 13-like isoform X1 [Seriola lalandi dorsalis]|uniref:ankyrin repeat and SOCS box protein 13-like isoform X1 n=1 Tax=Seriola lalandi dorsalis TaxID=1841481 RepID=UPI000C6F9DBF|nr:ankyrin repeat and SOCS box protein 13-like isoform X1 [Seriola lalandi dorsalis]
MEITRARPSLYGEIAHGLGFWTDRSAVHEAAAQGRALQLQQLIEGGAAVNIVAVDSITPLHEACIQGQTQCVRLLLDAGAQVSQCQNRFDNKIISQENQGKLMAFVIGTRLTYGVCVTSLCLYVLQVDARNIDGSTPLCDACAAGSLECVKLLLEYGATVNPPLFTFSPLHEACMGGNSDCVQLMIDQGAFMEAHDCHYGTPLHVACARQHYDCAKVLLNSGANVNAAKLHETALHHAAKTKNLDLVELLVEFGGNVYARDNLNKKPIQYTSLGSPCYLCLEFYENTPLSLQQISRVAVRAALGTRAREVVSQLGLPNRIISFLSYMPPPVIEI